MASKFCLKSVTQRGAWPTIRQRVGGYSARLRPPAWCGSKGAYDRTSCPCRYRTYRDGLLRQGAVDEAKADDQRHAGERQHHHPQVGHAVRGKQRKIVHDMIPKASLLLVAASRRKVQPLAPIAQMDLTHSVNGSASMRTRPQITRKLRNLAQRPAKPALGNGRLARADPAIPNTSGAIAGAALAKLGYSTRFNGKTCHAALACCSE